MKVFLAVLLSLSLFVPVSAFAADQAELMKKIDDMSRQLQELKQQMQDMQKKETAATEKITKVEKKVETASKPSWLEIGGDYRGRYDYLKGTVHDYYSFTQVLPFFLGMPGAQAPQLIQAHDVKNDALLTNRFGLNLKARATEDITVKARLLMYKVWGHRRTSLSQAPRAHFLPTSFLSSTAMSLISLKTMSSG